ncbi:hypothetical protein [Rhodophyticola porphyridii]|uniref:hypothetical protein n=1 Tax=Rhodophyticola porphyridii TaxID=1852017 RepID=UPI0035CF2F5A
MDDLIQNSAQTEGLRPPALVMRLARMGASFPTRLSFLRVLMRRLSKEQVRVTRRLWEMTPEGYGRAVYTLTLGGHSYALVAFSHHLPPEDRTDRVIAERWDTTYALFDGLPTPDDLDRLAENVPLQEAGRMSQRELVLSRANRSVRLFEHVVSALARGDQPEPEILDQTGYLMRTTAVYGNGKFGLADRAVIAGRPGLRGAFQVEMLTVWLIRHFTHDLADHIAHARAPGTAVSLSADTRRRLGIGNATGLGMAPFLVTHPELIHSWVHARETALARVRALPRARAQERAIFADVLNRAIAHAASWSVPDPVQMERIRELRTDLAGIRALTDSGSLHAPYPWEGLLIAASACGLEAQECLNALVMEPYGALVDDLAEEMQCGLPMRLDPSMRLSDLAGIIRHDYAWALKIDFDQPDETYQFWYVSEDKSEPRLGVRSREPGAELETRLDVARQVQELSHAVQRAQPADSVAAFLMRHPDQRHIVERVQTIAAHPYGEIRDNLIGRACLPIDLLRFKLAFFGATRFDPKSDRWTRITLCQGAPLAGEIAQADPDGWAFWAPPDAGAA